MPFREIKQPTGFIRIKSDGKIVISISLIRSFFNGKNNVKFFYDKEKHLIGIMPSDDGYKIYKERGNVKCRPISRIIQGEFYPKWNKKLKMLVFSYEGKMGS
jgi:hypothetical protein